jgi:anti-anti-sigma regulatory factor
MVFTGGSKMSFRTNAAIVKQLPASLNGEVGRVFFAELEQCMHAHRPFVVLDCSKLRHVDRATIQLLLCCLEEAMKRNGDVKLAAVSASAKASLKLVGIDRLFEFFDTVAEAMGNDRQAEEAVTSSALLAGPLQASESAA